MGYAPQYAATQEASPSLEELRGEIERQRELQAQLIAENSRLAAAAANADDDAGFTPVEDDSASEGGAVDEIHTAVAQH